jgi:hypothetical protein
MQSGTGARGIGRQWGGLLGNEHRVEKQSLLCRLARAHAARACGQASTQVTASNRGSRGKAPGRGCKGAGAPLPRGTGARSPRNGL